MNPSAESNSVFSRMLDSFLQERNIKWLLVAGTAILFGSSVMLVTSHWHSLGGTWKYLTLLTYVGIIHAFGQWLFHRLCLKTTGTVLMSLTVLLLPVSFVAWDVFVSPGQSESLLAPSTVASLGLLAANAAFALAAARRVFRHFLGGDQFTFVASYLGLSLGGALAPLIVHAGTMATLVATITAWGLYFAGSIKVNRHAFWLVESRRASCFRGFMPMTLLGVMFLGLYAMNFAQFVSWQWTAVGLVLFAIPILAAADAIEWVFQQRTGGRQPKYPWEIALPLAIGTLLTVGAVVIVLIDVAVSPLPCLAATPTAALAAAVFGWRAHRSYRHAILQSVFTYLAIGCTVIAYRHVPAFCHDLVQQLIVRGGQFVREPRLPIAFFGLSFPQSTAVRGCHPNLGIANLRHSAGELATHACCHGRIPGLVAAGNRRSRAGTAVHRNRLFVSRPRGHDCSRQH